MKLNIHNDRETTHTDNTFFSCTPLKAVSAQKYVVSIYNILLVDPSKPILFIL